MSRPEQHVQRPPVRWWQAVCVLGLLAGLLGMHGLAPGGGLPERTLAAHPEHSARHASGSPGPSAPTQPSVSSQQPPVAVPSVPVVAGTAHAGCPQDDGSCGGGHLEHADAVCASGAVSDGPVLPAPVPDPVPTAVCDGVVRACAADAPDGARAPPSLAELQLLRI
ncbi:MULTISPECIES: DUF6153 family protein [unclassified Streptomyces]|uniref:DUF6153 family protein n=1 Tax=unclassified Streptomyces TaxID=2593676 RepID=UPI00332975ED